MSAIQWHYTDKRDFIYLLSNKDPYHYIFLDDDLLYIDDVPSMNHNYSLKRIGCRYVKEYLEKNSSFSKKLKEDPEKFLYGTIDSSISLLGSEIYCDAIKFIIDSPSIEEADKARLISEVNYDYREYTLEKKQKRNSKIEIP